MLLGISRSFILPDEQIAANPGLWSWIVVRMGNKATFSTIRDS